MATSGAVTPLSDTDDAAPTKVPYHRRTVRNYMTSIPILFCCFTSGLVDSAVFNAWGVFATMQTGMFPLLKNPLPSMSLSHLAES